MDSLDVLFDLEEKIKANATINKFTDVSDTSVIRNSKEIYLSVIAYKEITKEVLTEIVKKYLSGFNGFKIFITKGDDFFESEDGRTTAVFHLTI